MSTIEAVFCFYFILAMISLLLHQGAMNKDVYYFSPCVLYRITKMNWFGCLFVSLLAWIVNPLYCCIMTIIYIIFYLYISTRWISCKIYAFIYWIFHIGRG